MLHPHAAVRGAAPVDGTRLYLGGDLEVGSRDDVAHKDLVA